MNIFIIFYLFFSPLHIMRGQVQKLTNNKSDEQVCKSKLQVFISEKLFKDEYIPMNGKTTKLGLERGELLQLQKHHQLSKISIHH